MGTILNRLSLLFAQILFSLVMPPLFIPRIARLRVTRLVVAFCFGRLYGDKYQHVIDSFQGRYGLAMAEGVRRSVSPIQLVDDAQAVEREPGVDHVDG